MEFKQFVEEVQENIKKYLPSRYQDAEVRMQEVNKNNGVKLNGLIVQQPDSDVAPTIYMEEYYERAREYGISISDTCKMISESILDSERSFDAKSFLTNDYVKDNVYVRLVGAENNKEMLSQVPHKLFHDLAATYRVTVSIEPGMNGSFQLSNEMLERFELDKEGLYDLALKNTMELFPQKLQSMEDILLSFGMSEEELALVGGAPEMYVLSNTHNVEGATTLLYPGVLEEISKAFGKDLVVLPSSLHEVIIVPKGEGMDAADFKHMVNEVNLTQVDAHEVLSNNVYEFDSRAKVLVPMGDPLYKANIEDLKRNGYKLTKSLETNLESLNKATGKNNTLKDVKDLEQAADAAPEVKELAGKISEECRVQEVARMMQER